MANIFEFEDDDRLRSKPALVEKEWPRLGGRPSPALKPTSGLKSVPQLSGTIGGSVWGASAPRQQLGTAKGGLAALLANSQPSTRAPSEAGDIAAERAAEQNASKGRNKKKKKSKTKSSAAKRGAAKVNTAGLERPDFLTPRVLKASPSVSSLREEIKPEDVEHTWSFVKKKLPPVGSPDSLSSSPPRSHLSSMLHRAHPGDVSNSSDMDDETPASSEYGEEHFVSYEIPIGEDYISKDVDSRPGSRRTSPSRKKICAEDFEPLKCLGKGAFGTVLLVRHKASGRLYAQKQLKKASIVIHKSVIEQTKTERAILESVQHPNVVKLHYAFQDHQKLYLILEYAEGGELFHHLADATMFPESTVTFYIAQLVLALEHLHQNVGVVYRDLKPENCLLDADGNLLLTDFGLSKISSESSRCSSQLGTPAYMAPEVLAGNEKEYGAEVDWWGVGILAFELLTGDTPFKGEHPNVVKEKIQRRKLALPAYLSPDAKDLITRLLRKEPTKRLGYNLKQDLPKIKGHRFFRNIDWKALERGELTPPIQPLVTDPLLAENFSHEFTELPLSPRVPSTFAQWQREDPFKGFSFVATSLLEQQMWRDEGLAA